MEVYQDFFHYRDGIYRRTPYGNTQMKGYHSVRVVGWGEERGDKYWVSWQVGTCILDIYFLGKLTAFLVAVNNQYL